MSVPTTLTLRRHKRTSSTLSTSTKSSPALPVAASFKRARTGATEPVAAAVIDDIKTTTLEYPRWQHEGLASDTRTPPSAPWSTRTLASQSESSDEDDESEISSGSSSESGNEVQDNRTIGEEDYTSSSSSSSSSDSDSDEVESESEFEASMERRKAEEAAELVSLAPNGSRPVIVAVGQSDLAMRLSSFLPSMAMANDALEVERVEGILEERNLEKVADGKSYIEMNLGLGIFAEKGCESSSDTEEEDEKPDMNNVLGRLMGKPKKTDIKPGIVVVEGADSRI